MRQHPRPVFCALPGKRPSLGLPKDWPCGTILTLAEIKAAVETFDRGETNVFDALDAIIVAVEAHQAAMARSVQRKDRHRDAA
jgi:hypothetical protein